MRKILIVGTITFAAMLAACGGSGATDPDDVSSSESTAINGTNLSVEVDYSVGVYKSLPTCNEKKVGQVGYVSLASKFYICEDGEWVVTKMSSRPESSTSENNPGSGTITNSSESSGGYDSLTGILTDSRDGQKYKTTKIGEQVWMAENLNYAYLQPTKSLDSSSFCYDNDLTNCKKYGRLYLWSAVMDSAGVLKNDGKGKGCGYEVECVVEGSIQGVCPKGWHLPSKDEFETLLSYVGATEKERSRNLPSNSWAANASDKYGFSALPAGFYNSYSKEFRDLGDDAYFWSSTEDYSYSVRAYFLTISYYYHANVDHYDYGKDNGSSVRCLQDSN